MLLRCFRMFKTGKILFLAKGLVVMESIVKMFINHHPIPNTLSPPSDGFRLIPQCCNDLFVITFKNITDRME